MSTHLPVPLQELDVGDCPKLMEVLDVKNLTALINWTLCNCTSLDSVLRLECL